MRVTFKSLVFLAATASFCMVIFNVSSTPRPTQRLHSRIAHITAQDLAAIRHSPDAAGVLPQPIDIPGVLSTSPRILLNVSGVVAAPCGHDCQPPRNKSVETPTLLSDARVPQHQQQQQNTNTEQLCDRACRLNKLGKKGLIRHSMYISRVQVENVTLPGSWTVTSELVDRLSQRQRHVQETCRKYGLDKANKTYQPNAWEFLINEEHNLAWCNVFKAASSTWFYNFNLLAGFSEFELLHTKESPVTLARKRYKRPSVEELKKVLNSTHPPLSFMIVRHPFERLVSGYRDKILSGNRYYSKLSRTVAKTYQGLASSVKDREWKWPKAGRPSGAKVIATFPQFVQFLLDETSKGNKLDEHWIPMSTFCTPCLVPFDVFAKVETLQEDGNYIIFSSGIKDIIKPKMINRARDGPTKEVASRFLCQLTKEQMEGLIQMYKMDLELFQYDVSKYQECVRESDKTNLTSLGA
ncbi:hypothetical protein O3P69_002904 [Scylla paramamosain]|uniref:Carbohydrate sulfotransferase n=1 Tax=Scylla paramamosain TaxID=85552 RepID=A0AAW0UQJ2_SCYPA